jgi:hypothetical protein
MGINVADLALQERQQLFLECFPSHHPLVVLPAAVVVRTVQLRAGDALGKPVKKIGVPHVHPQRDLGVKPVTPEVAFPHQDAQEKPLFEVGQVHEGTVFECCFTVKFPVKHLHVRGSQELFHRHVYRETRPAPWTADTGVQAFTRAAPRFNLDARR